MRLIKTPAKGQLPLLLLCCLFVLIPAFLQILPPLAYADQHQNPPAQQEYFYGVSPFLPTARLEGVFAPIAAEISKKTGKTIHYRSANNLKNFTRKLANQEFDIAFIQPFDYVATAEKAGYLPVAKRKEPLSAILVVKKESLLTGISDLRGKTVAMPPLEAALSYIGKAALLDAGLSPDKDVIITHMKGHHACLQQVLLSEASGCVTGRPALRMFENKLHVNLKVLAETRKFPAMLFVVHSRVTEADRRLIRETLLNTTLPEVNPDLRTLLMQDKKPPFIAVTAGDYAIIRDFREQMRRD